MEAPTLTPQIIEVNHSQSLLLPKTGKTSDLDLPYPIGSSVCLKTFPSRQYVVLEVQEDVDLSDTSGHIKNPNGGRQHFYKLRTASGGQAHWWHHQLQIVF